LQCQDSHLSSEIQVWTTEHGYVLLSVPYCIWLTTDGPWQIKRTIHAKLILQKKTQ